MTLPEFLRDPAFAGRLFADRHAWLTAATAIAGLPLDAAGAALFTRCTGRTVAPAVPVRESWFVVGRRGGKSHFAAALAAYVAACRDYRPHLAPGERATVMLLAADRRQARVAFRYVRGLFDAELLRPMIAGETRESIELTNGVTLEIHTSNLRSVRGYTCAAVIADEIAFWPTDEAGASPDTETLAALRPAMATIPGSMLIAISSPYARRGALWEAYRRHYGQDSPVLVWQAPTATMHPTIDPAVIADAYAADEASAAAEYGAEFRRDVESFVSRETVDACVVPDRGDLPPSGALHYVAFVDPSGGSADAMTLAIAHTERRGVQHVETVRGVERQGGRDVVVVDAVRERRPPFSPADVVAEFAALLRTYRIASITGDRYAGQWPRERFREAGIRYEVADRTRSDFYRDALPLLTSTSIELPDHARLVAQLCSLERRTGRGKDSIDHAPRAHDDIANAVAGVAVLAAGRGGGSRHRISPLIV